MSRAIYEPAFRASKSPRDVLFLLVKIESARYALEANRIVEVLPLVEMKRVPGAASELAGLFNYNGVAVPAFDLSVLALGRPAAQRLSTRIAVLRYRDGDGAERLLGVVAEGACETIECRAEDFAELPLPSGSVRYLSPPPLGDRWLVQRLDVDRLLAAALRSLVAVPVTG